MTAYFTPAQFEAAARRMDRANKARRASMDIADANTRTHRIGVIDDCYRCLRCEVGAWNAHKYPCPA